MKISIMKYHNIINNTIWSKVAPKSIVFPNPEPNTWLIIDDWLNNSRALYDSNARQYIVISLSLSKFMLVIS